MVEVYLGGGEESEGRRLYERLGFVPTNEMLLE